MPRQKTTEAEHISIRLNPKTSEHDAKTLEIIKRLKEQGFSVKAIVQDAILRADGHTPEMFHEASAINDPLLFKMEALLTRFANDLITQLSATGVRVVTDESESDEPQSVSSYARNFARGFIQRQQQSGDDDD